MTERDYHLVADASARTVTTRGLSQYGLWDIEVPFIRDSLLREAEAFIRFMVEYQYQSKKVIRPEETVTYGYWTVKFIRDQEILRVCEYLGDGRQEWAVGVERTLSYWQGQRELCSSFGVAFAPPHGSEFALVSAGVLEHSFPVEGVRYPSEAPDSGWIFTTDMYDGNIYTLKKVHLHHVTDARQELARVVGLPFGFYFRITTDPGTSGIWFDSDVANTQK